MLNIEYLTIIKTNTLKCVVQTIESLSKGHRQL